MPSTKISSILTDHPLRISPRRPISVASICHINAKILQATFQFFKNDPFGSTSRLETYHHEVCQQSDNFRRIQCSNMQWGQPENSLSYFTSTPRAHQKSSPPPPSRPLLRGCIWMTDCTMQQKRRQHCEVRDILYILYNYGFT